MCVFVTVPFVSLYHGIVLTSVVTIACVLVTVSLILCSHRLRYCGTECVYILV